MDLRRHIRPVLGLLIIVSIAFVVWYFSLASYINLEKIHKWVDEAGSFGSMAFVVICIVGVIIHLPEIILIAIGGVLFGGVRGFVYGWVGSVVGSSITFLFVRYFMKDVFQRQVANRIKYLQIIDEQFEKHGFKTMLFLRLLFFMSPPINWFIAVTKVKFSHYFAGSMIGVIPGVAITAYAAGNIAKAKSLSDLVTSQHIIAVLLIIILITVTIVAARKILGKSIADKARNG